MQRKHRQTQNRIMLNKTERSTQNRNKHKQHSQITDKQNRKKNRTANIDNQYHMWLNVLLKKKYKCYFSRF